MYQDEVILCSASKYTQKYYLNEDFENLPTEVKKELRILCTLFTEDVGGIMMLVFDSMGNLNIVTDAAEEDILYDEIGCGLVPIDAFEREYREAHGRIMTELAARAKRVDRVICGIGTRLV